MALATVSETHSVTDPTERLNVHRSDGHLGPARSLHQRHRMGNNIGGSTTRAMRHGGPLPTEIAFRACDDNHLVLALTLEMFIGAAIGAFNIETHLTCPFSPYELKCATRLVDRCWRLNKESG